MKKLIVLIVSLLLIIPGVSFAKSLDLSGTELKQGVAYSIIDSKFNYLSTLEVAKWKDITLELGYAGDAENTQNKAVAVISYPIIRLSDYVDLPILNLIECNLGVYGGYGRITGSDEFDAGASATLINIKF